MGRALLNALEHGGFAALEDAKFWRSMAAESNNAKIGQQTGEEMMRPAVYVRSELDDVALEGVYTGRTAFNFFRFIEHLCTILLGASTGCRYAYESSRQSTTVLTWSLWEGETATGTSVEAWTQRAIIEGLWALLLCSYTRSLAYLLFRRQYGLLECSTSVRGCNGTECFEAPESWKPPTHGRDGGVRDRLLLMVTRRAARYSMRMFAAQGAGHGLDHACSLAKYQATQLVQSGMFASSLLGYGLAFAPSSTHPPRLFKGINASQADINALWAVAASGEWVFEIREGGPTSLRSLTPSDLSLFGQLALVRYSACPDERSRGGEVVFYFDRAPMSRTMREFWDWVLTLLPPTSLERRRAAHRAAVDEITALRLM